MINFVALYIEKWRWFSGVLYVEKQLVSVVLCIEKELVWCGTLY